MHISLDSALGQQRRLNQVGESITQIAPDPAAAYSLRSLTGSDPKVVRVRRESDNHEQDFTASEVSSGALVDFVNTQVTAPLDIQALTSTGRDGDFLIAKAAYSLRSLGTRQATVAATGDTVARANGKYVCQVRRSSDDALKSFTADEITDGTLLSFVGTGGSDNGFVKTWYDQSVTTQAGDTATGNHATQATAASQPKIVSSGSLNTDGGLLFASSKFGLVSSVSLGSAHSIFAVAKTSTITSANHPNLLTNATNGRGIGFYVDSIKDKAIDSDNANNSFTFSSNTNRKLMSVTSDATNVNGFENGTASSDNSKSQSLTNNDFSEIGGGSNFAGTIEEIIVYLSDQTDNRTAIEANIGEHYSISGIPAFDNSVNGFVETWYDQSGNGNNLTQATASKQPTIVTSGAINTRNSQPIIKFIQANSTFLEIADSSMFPTGSSFALTIFHALHIKIASGGRIGVLGHNSSGNNAATNSYRFGTQSSRRVVVKFADASSTQALLQSGFYTDDTDSILTYQVALNGGTASLQAFNNGSSLSSNTISTADQSYSPQADKILLGARSTVDNFSDSEFFEVIAYDSDQLSNRSAIETNMNSHYSIF